MSEPSQAAKDLLIAMTTPVVATHWSGEDGSVRPWTPDPYLPDRRYCRLDPGYSELDDEVLALMTRGKGCTRHVYTIGPELMERIEGWRKERAGD